MFISNDVRDTKTGEPKQFLFAYQFKSVDPVGGSNNMDNKIVAAVDPDVVI